MGTKKSPNKLNRSKTSGSDGGEYKDIVPFSLEETELCFIGSFCLHRQDDNSSDDEGSKWV